MRKTALLIVAAIAGLIGIQGCERHEDSGKVRSAIEARNKELGAAFAKGDYAAVAGMYSSSAQLFPPNAPVVSGHDAIQGAWKSFIDGGFKGLELSTSEVEAVGDHADEEGTYRLVGPDGQTTADSGKYMVIWKKENGQWFLHRDIWNSSSPPPPPPAAPAPETTEAPAAAPAPAEAPPPPAP